jgi:hypothetical protein
MTAKSSLSDWIRTYTYLMLRACMWASKLSPDMAQQLA